MNIIPDLGLSRSGIIFFYVISFLSAIAAIYLIAIEAYTTTVTLAILWLGCLAFINLFWGILLLIISSFFVEGNLLYEFVLFRLFGFNWYVIDLVMVVVFIAFFFHLNSNYGELPRNKFTFLIAAFLLIATFGIYWGTKQGNKLQSVFYDYRGFFYYVTLIPTYFVLRKDKDAAWRLLVVIIVLGFVKSGVDSVFSLFLRPLSYDQEARTTLTFARLSGANEIAYPITFICSALAAYFSLKIPVKLFCGLAALVSGLATYLSYTRGSWFMVAATIIIFFVMLMIWGNKRVSLRSAMLYGCGVTVLVFFLSAFNFINLSTLFNRAFSVSFSRIDISNLGRLVEYATALEAFVRHPVLGAGLGYMFTYFAPGIGEVSTEYCHNSYLYIMAKMGIVGLLPMLAIIGYVFSIVIRNVKRHSDNEQYVPYIVLPLVIIAIAFKALTTWHLNTVTFSPFVGILFGIAAYSAQQKGSTNE